MRMLFVMDPVERINIRKDTTFAFMLEAQARGHEVHVCGLEGLRARGSSAWATASRVTLRREEGNHVDVEEPVAHPLEHWSAVWMRKDPPFDMEYVYATYLLERADPSRTLVLNRPSGLRNANEKAFILNVPEVTPETMIGRDRGEIRRFVEEVGGVGVIKPLDGMGGAGIFQLRLEDPNFSAIWEGVTDHGRRFAMVQSFVPEAAQGDKRLLLMDGEPLGAILRVPARGEFRGNMAAGGTAVAAEVTERDREIVAAVAPRLREEGLWFVGLDIIGGLLTEVNVTSPTGVQEANRLCGLHVEGAVLDWVEGRVPRSA
ncbi:MAG: glutathione synthase [Deltaproteobacteria bacterium]|nr:MAG: glutathione synthase [Deltaproteobacteria bacterium]